jgi:hypothetical protein
VNMFVLCCNSTTAYHLSMLSFYFSLCRKNNLGMARDKTRSEESNSMKCWC